MGKPLPAAVTASGTPPALDQANAVIQGSFSAVGPREQFTFYGAYNVAIWGTSAATTLTTTAGSSTATVGSATGWAAGLPINSVNVPPGTTVGAISGTTVTLAFPPGVTNASVVTGADAAATVAGVAWDATVRLERSFDAGLTWLTCGVGGAGQGAIYTGSLLAGQPVSITGAEPEKGVAYRLNCPVYASGVINYRMSTTGLAAVTWGINVG